METASRKTQSHSSERRGFPFPQLPQGTLTPCRASPSPAWPSCWGSGRSSLDAAHREPSSLTLRHPLLIARSRGGREAAPRVARRVRLGLRTRVAPAGGHAALARLAGLVRAAAVGRGGVTLLPVRERRALGALRAGGVVRVRVVVVEGQPLQVGVQRAARLRARRRRGAQLGRRRGEQRLAALAVALVGERGGVLDGLGRLHAVALLVELQVGHGARWRRRGARHAATAAPT